MTEPSRPVALVADRISWEERELIKIAPDFGLAIEWVNDESLCLGHPDAPSVHDYDALLLRSRSYTRGGLIATLAEAAGVPVLNTAKAVHTCENKAVLRTVLRTAGVPVPDYRLVLSRKDFEKSLDELRLPLVLKPVYGGMGKRVTLIRHADTAQSVYDYVEDLGHAFEQACLVEPYLGGGTSVRCLVVGHELVGAAEFASGGTDWRNNAALGNSSRAVAHDPDVLKIIDGVVAELGPGIYGVDLFGTPDGYVVNEVNHAPGFRGVAAATGADIPSAVARHVQELIA